MRLCQPLSQYNGTRFVTDKGKTLNFNQLTKKQQALFHDYQMIQYDITKGGQYSIAAGMQKKS